MKRKTNLFYTSGPDSKFLTFSNYTEALTGSFLSVDSKLFPDKFLCLKVSNLNSKTKVEFIKYLATYYENKLAALRDAAKEKNKTIETHIYPLAYLLEAILNVVDYNTETKEFILKTNVLKNELSISEVYGKMNNLEYIDNLITYVGDVTEFDYNGTYTDIICNVNLNSYKEGLIEFNEMTNLIESVSLDDDINLYGWKDEQFIIDDYKNKFPVFDAPGTYYNNTYLSKIKFNQIEDGRKLSFNIIIPLFTHVYVNSVSTNNSYDNEINLNDSISSCKNCPLGIWIYADSENDTFIDLIKDHNLDIYPSWSLLISTQFKPFPYSNTDLKEKTINESSLNAFSTFAEVLSKMNNVLDSFNEMNENINRLNNRISSIEGQLNNIATDARMDDFNKRLCDLRTSVYNEIKDLKQHIVNLKWSNVG